MRIPGRKEGLRAYRMPYPSKRIPLRRIPCYTVSKISHLPEKGYVTAMTFAASSEMKIGLAPGQEEMLSTKETIKAIIEKYPDTVMAFDIFDGDELIGFALVHRFEERKYFLWEYAIDAKHQNMCKGTRALREFIDLLKTRYGAKEITTTYIWGNERAKHVYESVGFVETDVVDVPDCHEVNMLCRL